LAEKHEGLRYLVFDDLKDQIAPSILSKGDGPNPREEAFKIY